MTSDAQYGHRFSPGHDVAHTDELRGARFDVRDLRGAHFEDCDLSGAVLRDCALVDVDVSGWVQGLVVNGVDVTAFVEAELDRRHPERVQMREIRSAAGFRAMWAELERLWAAATERARQLPDEALHQSVRGEWSFVQTLRHLVFVTDAWASRTVLDDENPYHRLGLTQSWYPDADALALGIENSATPSTAEVLAARADRQAVVRRVLEGLADDDLGRPCSRAPAPGYPEGDRPVFECLAVVVEEEVEHLRFATRDLAVLEQPSSA